MDLDSMDPNYWTRFRAYTSRVYRDAYPSIDPTSPALSQRNQVVIVSGAGSGIGAQGIAPAFAKAGARALVLVGRRPDKLKETASAIRKHSPSVEIMEVPTDISDYKAVEALFSSVEAKYGAATVLVNNAAVLNGPHGLATSQIDKWWTDFEINARGTYFMCRAFLKSLGTEKYGCVINLSTGASTIPVPGMSSYGTSKLAVNRLTEFITIEHPNVTAITLDPGMVESDMMFDQFRKFALDTPELVGGTAVWLSTKEASFLNGRFILTNWSVDELMARKEEIQGGDDLKIILQGKFGIDSQIID